MQTQSRTTRRVRQPKKSILARLVKPSRDACWTWTGALNSIGYGVCRIRSRYILVHRFMLSLKLGRSILPQHDAHHLCEVKACANPAHLVEVPSPDHRQWNLRGFDGYRSYETREQFRARTVAD